MEASDAPQHASSDDAAPPDAGGGFPVVGLGASAGGLGALQTFFDHVPTDSGMGFVIILHLSPEHESQLAETLQRHSELPVQQVTETVRLEPDHVYAIPPGQHLSVHDGELRLSTPEDPRGRRSPIDLFFRSLASAHGSAARAIVLSGTGTDGSQGIQHVKEQGGVVLAQDPEEAEHSGMPRSAIATEEVDFVLPVAEMPAKLQELDDHEVTVPPPDGGEVSDGDEQALETILEQLHAGSGHDFSHYKRNTLHRRIHRRMQLQGNGDLSGYARLLRQDPEEVAALARDLLISVTRFFRDEEAFTALERKVIPSLLEPEETAHRSNAEEVRVWITGCATGEEAYSIAMLLAEHRHAQNPPTPVKIFATDLDEAALERARKGLYPDAIRADLSEERLDRFFEKQGESYRIQDALRGDIIFAKHNLIEDPPFSRLDLIVCRNLLIYLNREMQKKVIQLFSYGLRPGGHLMLGTSESIGEASSLFATVDAEAKLFQRRALDAGVQLPAFPISGSGGPPVQQEPEEEKTDGASFDEIAQKVLFQWFEHPCVIVTEDLKLAYVSGTAGTYLDLAEGKHPQSILKMARAELHLPLQTALHKAIHEGARTAHRNVPVHTAEGRTLVHLTVLPIHEPAAAQGFAMVVFEDAEPTDGETPAASGASETDSAAYQSTIDELEETNEAVRRDKEELQSMNEELRSTMEELEVSREELQSTNEELATVNQELENKVAELRDLNSDLNNLMASTETATLFLDGDLNLKRYAPEATDIFNLIQSDEGRPFAHLSHNLNEAGLTRDARRVLENEEQLQREVVSEGGTTYLMRVLPYRNVEGTVDGVVFTFTDITWQKDVEAELRAAKEKAEAANQAKSSFLAGIGHDIRTPLTAITGFAEALAESDDPTLHDRYPELIRTSGEKLMSMLNEVLKLARLEGGDIDLHSERLELVAETREMLQPFGEQARTQGLSFELAVPDDDIDVHLDRAALDRVLMNLVTNAIKFTDEGKITVTVRAVDGAAQIQVEDPGAGIGASSLEHIFEAFHQEPAEGAQVEEGIGLGMAIAKRLVEAMDGAISVESEKGQGSTFTVRFPLATEEQTSTDGSPPSGAQPAGDEASRDASPAPPGKADARPRLLVVEDHPETRELFQAVLRTDYELELVRDADAALDAARRTPFDAALIDFNLREKRSGIDLLRALREVTGYEDVPAVACTAYVAPENRERFLEAGFADYVEKPFTPEKLRTALRRVLERRNA